MFQIILCTMFLNNLFLLYGPFKIIIYVYTNISTDFGDRSSQQYKTTSHMSCYFWTMFLLIIKISLI
jgi:hypothetical protein